jgi:DNA end-binding protein Ku
MARRSIFNATIQFGSVRVPVKLYAASEDRTVHFHMVHASDGVPVQQRMVSSVTGEAVSSKQVQRGYPLPGGSFVLVREAELENLAPKRSSSIEIVRFIPRGEIKHHWYERPYYLGPSGDDEAYFALAEALARQEEEGIARWVMRGKDYVGALTTHGDHLMLISLHHTEEVVMVPGVQTPKELKLDQKETRLAEQLVASLEADFDPFVYQDQYREHLEQLIEAKARGRQVKLRKATRKRAEGSLAEALRKSLGAAKEKRVA